MSLLHTMRAVGWAFVGIRKRSAYEDDLGRLKPGQIVLVALLAVVLFVGGLIGLVHWIA